MAEINEQVVPEIVILKADEYNTIPFQFVFYKAVIEKLNKSFYGVCTVKEKEIDTLEIRPNRELKTLIRKELISESDIKYEIIKIFDNNTDAIFYSIMHTDISYIPEEEVKEDICKVAEETKE